MLAYHSGEIFQRGQGLGNFFSGLFKSVLPVASSFLKSSAGKVLKDVALSTASNLASDIIKGKNVKNSAVENLSSAKNKISSYLKRKFAEDPEELEIIEPKYKKARKKVKRKNVKFNLLHNA